MLENPSELVEAVKNTELSRDGHSHTTIFYVGTLPHLFCTTLDLQLSFYHQVFVITVELTTLYCSVYVLQVSYYLTHILILWYHLNVRETIVVMT